MAWFDDLTPYTYSEADRGALNVGWLDRDHPFPTGATDPLFARKLVELCIKHRMNVMRGWQECQFCPWAGLEQASTSGLNPVLVGYEGMRYALGDAEIRVTHADGSVFAAPNLIAHYVVEHHYVPPAEFIAAVLADPRVNELPP